MFTEEELKRIEYLKTKTCKECSIAYNKNIYSTRPVYRCRLKGKVVKGSDRVCGEFKE